MSRNGPPDAVRISRRTSADGRRAGTGGSRCARCPRAGPHAAAARGLHDDRAGHHEDFLVREGDRLARLDRREHGVERRRCRTMRTARCPPRDGSRPRSGPRRRSAPRGAAPTSAPQLGAASVQRARRRHRDRVRPEARDLLGQRAMFSPAASATTRRRSGCASTTASALWPIEPVDPRMAMRFIEPVMIRTEVPDEDVIDGCGEQPAVDSIEHAAMARDQRTRILDAGAALQQRLEQVADDAERRQRWRRRAPANARRTAGQTRSARRARTRRSRTPARRSPLPASSWD